MIKRSCVWVGRYGVVNVVFDRKPGLFAAYVGVTMVAIIARRLLAAEAWKSMAPLRVQTLIEDCMWLNVLWK